MSLHRTIIRNIAANWVGFAIQVSVTFFLTPFVLRSLGDVRYGTWALIVSLTGYYGFLDLGFRASLTQYLSRYLATKEFDKLNDSATAGFISSTVVGGFVLVAGLVCSVYAPAFFSLPDDIVSDVRYAILICSVGAALQFPLFVFSAVFPATQRYDLANVISVSSRLVMATGTIIALKMDYGLVGVSVALFASNLIDYLMRWRIAYRLIPSLRLCRTRMSFSRFKEFISYGVWNVLIGGSQRVLNLTDVLLIGYFLPIAFVAPYAIAYSLVAYLNKLLKPAARVFFPAAVRLDATDNQSGQQQLYLMGTRLLLSIIVIAAALGVIWCVPFFQLWLGMDNLADVYATIPVVFTILIAAAAITGAQRVGYQILLGRRRMRLLGILVASETVCNVILSISLISYAGLYGIAMGTLISTFVFNGIIQPIVVNRELNIPILQYLNTCMTRSAIVGLLAFAMCWGIREAAGEPGNWLALLLQGALAFTVSGLVLVFIGITSEERERYITPRVSSLFRRSASTIETEAQP